MTDKEFEAVMKRIDLIMKHANIAAIEAEAALKRAELFLNQMANTLIAETEEFLREQA
jgi:Tfp pilus assembly protein PilX